MKKFGKYVLIFCGVCLAFGMIMGIINIIAGTSQGKSMDQIAEESEQYNPNQEEETAPVENTDSDKPDDFIENLDLNQALQLAINNQGFLVGHLENADLAMDKKIANAQEVKDRVKPYRDTLLYLIQQDSGDGGEYDTRRMQIYYAVDYVYQMAQYSLDYFDSGSQEDLDDFYKYDDLAEKYIDLARENQQ